MAGDEIPPILRLEDVYVDFATADITRDGAPGDADEEADRCCQQSHQQRDANSVECSDQQIAAEPVDKVVDTTGAGDAYAAGFLYGLARGRPLNVSGRLGSIAAAEVISHYGARPEASLRDLAIKAGL